MTGFLRRFDPGQRVCLGFIVVSGLGSLLGLVSPYWLRLELTADMILAEATITVNMGIIYSCFSQEVSVVGNTLAGGRQCRMIGIDKDDGFDMFQFARLLSVLGAVGVLLLGPVTWFLSYYYGYRAARTLGIAAVIAGLMGVAGGAIFIWKTQDTVGNVAPLASMVTKLLNIFVKDILDHSASVSWACYLYMVACSLLVIIGLILASLPGERPPSLIYVVSRPRVRMV